MRYRFVPLSLIATVWLVPAAMSALAPLYGGSCWPWLALLSVVPAAAGTPPLVRYYRNAADRDFVTEAFAGELGTAYQQAAADAVAGYLDNPDRTDAQVAEDLRETVSAFRNFDARIEWTIEDVESPEEAAAVMWHYVCESVGPVVEVIEHDTGEVHDVDLYELNKGHPFP